MEGLVIIIAEMLFALIAPLLGVLAGLLAAIAELILTLFLSLFDMRGARRRSGGAGDAPLRKRKVSPRWLHIPAAIAGVVAVAVLIANFFFFDPLVRYGLDRVAARTGYAVAFEDASGNLLTGRLALDGVTVARDEGEGLGVDMRLDHTEFDVALLSLIRSTRRIEAMTVEGVRGTVRIPLREEGEAPKKARRGFAVDLGRFDDIDITVARATDQTHRVEIASAEVAPFRSSTALFDLFFRSNLDGRIDGVPIKVATEVIAGNGRRTSWVFDEVPATTLAELTDRAPLNWLSGGTLSAHVEDEWALDDRRVDMDWSIALDGVRVAPPPGVGVTERLAATALGKAIERSGGSAEFDFTLGLDRERLETSSSGDLDALWDALKDGIAEAVAKSTGKPAEGVKAAIGKAGSKLRDMLDPAGGDESQP